MRLAKASMKLFFSLALSFCLLPVAGAQAKPPVKKSAHKAKAATAAPAAAPAAGAAATKPASAEAGKRDPFIPLVNEHKPGGGAPLPPGKAGLVVATVRIDGAVSSPGGMLAVVSNPDQRVYFLREGDRLYDGDVEKIGLDGVTFKENSKDAFGKPVERLVTKRIYPSAGEQQ
jgi:Tfp pilus assembly protein PilP